MNSVKKVDHKDVFGTPERTPERTIRRLRYMILPKIISVNKKTVAGSRAYRMPFVGGMPK